MRNWKWPSTQTGILIGGPLSMFGFDARHRFCVNSSAKSFQAQVAISSNSNVRRFHLLGGDIPLNTNF